MNNLRGKRVVITRPEKQSQSFVNLLINYEAIPICFPVIEITPIKDNSSLDSALTNLSKYDWLILTSVNGVLAVWNRLEELGIESLPVALKIASIGPKTAAALEKKGCQPDFIPDEYIAEAIIPGLGDLTGLRVLLTRADIARSALPDAIKAGGGIADDICAYQTIPTYPDEASHSEIIKGVDAITFTSPSTVENFFRIVENFGINPLQMPGDPTIACIGPITAQAAKEKGFSVSIFPEDYTIEGLFSALINYFQDN